jgi:hypothetical protein
VPGRDRRLVSDGRQVDRLIPGEQQSGVAGDDRARAWIEAEAQLCKTRVEGSVKGRREGRKVLDARRERLTRTVQAPLLSVVPLRAVRAPLPASSLIAPPVESRSSVMRPVRGRVSPCPSRVPLPERPQCGCRTVMKWLPRVNGVIHECAAGDEGCG